MSRVPQKQAVDTRKATNVNLDKYDEKLQDMADARTGGHNAVLHQALDHLCAGLFHAAGQLTHGDLVGDLHGNRGLFDDLQAQLAETVGLLLLALVAGEIVVPALLIAELLLALGAR